MNGPGPHDAAFPLKEKNQEPLRLPIWVRILGLPRNKKECLQ
jgi:hypothetical protein